MGSLSIKLPEPALEWFTREAKKKGIPLEEYVARIVMKHLPPLDRARKYIVGARECLYKAKERLEKEDRVYLLREADCAMESTVVAFALWKNGSEPLDEVELWDYKNQMEETLGEWVHDAWTSAYCIQYCFHIGFTKKDLKLALERIRKLIDAVAELLRED